MVKVLGNVARVNISKEDIPKLMDDIFHIAQGIGATALDVKNKYRMLETDHIKKIISDMIKHTEYLKERLNFINQYLK